MEDSQDIVHSGIVVLLISISADLYVPKYNDSSPHHSIRTVTS